jgi:hypothetical protein
MKIYLVPFTLINEENEREIKKKTFGLEPIDAPSFWYLHGALQHEFIFDKAYMYVDWETYKSDIVETKDERNYLVPGIYDVEVEEYDNPCKAFMWQSEEGGITLLRGLVVDPTIEEDLKDAQKKYEEKPFML